MLAAASTAAASTSSCLCTAVSNTADLYTHTRTSYPCSTALSSPCPVSSQFSRIGELRALYLDSECVAVFTAATKVTRRQFVVTAEITGRQQRELSANTGQCRICAACRSVLYADLCVCDWVWKYLPRDVPLVLLLAALPAAAVVTGAHATSSTQAHDAQFAW